MVCSLKCSAMARANKMTAKQWKLLHSVARAPFSKEEEARFPLIRHHSVEKPHWSSEILDWPSDRWDPMSTAPITGRIIDMNVRDSKGKITHDVHYAEDMSGEFQPAFRGYFNSKLFEVVDVCEWQPTFAKSNPPRNS